MLLAEKYEWRSSDMHAQLTLCANVAQYSTINIHLYQEPCTEARVLNLHTKSVCGVNIHSPITNFSLFNVE